ncbi:glycoside hydrolase family protein [Microbacterium radiodurans]|uniref:Family 43 glycosylhydrolase n=1 Tax=Microbacterium radiodurans TaxID=661398 RepID=A0A5J5IYJ3_9MICO|nr:family 43 glycosylhydrolase [Microbacterium radiodurans]KAA9089630.1 family 43 glycosylhydrolase [Microbacterium radiodurans]
MTSAPALPRELYRDPVYDGATDPVVVSDASGGWWMFYTQRRAIHPDPGPGVAWVHGSRIGVARSDDGVSWSYVGTLEPDAAGLRLAPGAPPAEVDRTHWAPEVVWDGDLWWMFLTEIDGVPDRWPGFARTIVAYTSHDLEVWERRAPLALSSDRVIDAAVARTPDGRWRLWYKDEAADSVTMVAASDDLSAWELEGFALGGRPHEGPSAFELDGRWWLIVDEWRGMGVHRSDDALTWERQGDADAVVLGAGTVPGTGFGHHGAPVRDGERLWYYFFAQPSTTPDAGGDGADTDDVDARRCAVYRAELRVVDGVLVCEPDAGG